MIIRIKKQIEQILYDQFNKRVIHYDGFHCATTSEELSIIKEYERKLIESVIQQVSPELMATPEYVSLMVVRNIIFGYRDEEIESLKIVEAVKDIKEEIERIKQFSDEKEIEIYSKRGMKESVESAANISEYYKNILYKNDFGKKNHSRNVYEVLLEMTETTNQEELFYWCMFNRFHLPNKYKRNYVKLSAIAPGQAIWIADADGNFVVKGQGKVVIELLPDIYEVYFRELKTKPEIIKLYKDIMVIR